jgi:catalase
MTDEFNLQTPPRTGQQRILIRVITLLFCLGIAVGGFAFAGGWLSPNALTPARMIDTFEQVNGVHPGFRRNHAKGVCFSGFFDGNGQGSALSRATVFKACRVPVIGRFALGGAQPFVADDPHTIRSMAILFKLPDGQQWRTGMNSIPIFPVNTAQEFYELLMASAPDAKTAKPDPKKMDAFLSTHLGVAKALESIRNSPISSGFENSQFNSLDAFLLVDEQGKTRAVRWSMIPEQSFEPYAPGRSTDAGKNFLFDALIAAVHKQSLRWDLIITVADPDDPTNDASVAWPPNRRTINVGTLTVDRIESEETSPARDINFDPLILPDGITGSDDPLLSARSAAYSPAFTRREGEARQPSAISPAEVMR